jgi:nitroreductase
MNEVIQQIKNRKSVRVYEDKIIEPEIKAEIINSAVEAPTAGGMMLYSIIDVTDQAVKNKLAVLCDNQPFIAKAPLVLIFLADYQRWYDTFVYEDCNPRKPEVGDLLIAYTDAGVAAQNTVVAAEAFGIGSCYIGDIMENCEAIRELLNLPEFVMPAAMLVYGYPTQGQMTRKKPARFDKEYIVFENSYRNLDKDDLKSMHQLREAKEGRETDNITGKLQAFCKRKYMSEFCKEMSRSAKVYLKEFE